MRPAMLSVRRPRHDVARGSFDGSESIDSVHKKISCKESWRKPQTWTHLVNYRTICNTFKVQFVTFTRSSLCSEFSLGLPAVCRSLSENNEATGGDFPAHSSNTPACHFPHFAQSINMQYNSLINLKKNVASGQSFNVKICEMKLKVLNFVLLLFLAKPALCCWTSWTRRTCSDFISEKTNNMNR